MSRIRIWAYAFVAILVVVSPGCRDRAPQRRTVQSEQYLVGAHYYVWYPSNLKQGYVRAKLSPPQQPVLGLYSSQDPTNAEQHIAWCSQYGIDFLTLDWWPSRPKQNDTGIPGFLKARNLGDIKFCIFFETWALGFNPKTGSTEFTDESVAGFCDQMNMLADRFFEHPSYLKLAGRPVVFLYLTRTFSGKYREAIGNARIELGKRGVDPFFIGDEIFWGVIAETDNEDGSPRAGNGPQHERIALFDAIFGYNLYDWSKTTHAGYGGSSDFVPDCSKIYSQYCGAALPMVGFVPDILPGYNDRGVRCSENHYVIPRQWSKGMPEGSFLGECFHRLVFPFMDPDLNMMLITSWNEWNEDTAIEPVADAAPTSRDISETGQMITQGFDYYGFGMRHLEVVRDNVVAICGRVLDATGAAAPGRLVQARAGRRIVAERAADSRGYYRLSRLHVPAGDYTVGVKGTGETRPVSVGPGQSVTGVHFIVTGI